MNYAVECSLLTVGGQVSDIPWRSVDFHTILEHSLKTKMGYIIVTCARGVSGETTQH